MIPAVFDSPVMGVDAVESVTGSRSQATDTALTRLEEAAAVQEIRGCKRDKVRAGSNLLGELTALDSRIAAGSDSAELSTHPPPARDHPAGRTEA